MISRFEAAFFACLVNNSPALLRKSLKHGVFGSYPQYIVVGNFATHC
jgi:hypothetical protein